MVQNLKILATNEELHIKNETNGDELWYAIDDWKKRCTLDACIKIIQIILDI